MAVTYVSSSGAHHDGSTNILTVPVPSPLTDGDILCFFGFFNGGVVTFPSGWTQLTPSSGGGNFYYATKIAAGESGNYVFTSTVSGIAVGAVAALTGVVDQPTGIPADQGTMGAHQTGSFISDADPAFAVMAHIIDNADIGAPIASGLATSQLTVGADATIYLVLATDLNADNIIPEYVAGNVSPAVTEWTGLMVFGPVAAVTAAGDAWAWI